MSITDWRSAAVRAASLQGVSPRSATGDETTPELASEGARATQARAVGRLHTVHDSVHRAAIVSQGVGQRRSNGINFREKVASVTSSTNRPASNWRRKLGVSTSSANSEDPFSFFLPHFGRLDARPEDSDQLIPSSFNVETSKLDVRRSFPPSPAVASPHHLVHLLLELELGIGREQFPPAATGRFCGVSWRPRRIFRRNSLLDNHAPLRYTIGVNNKTGKLRLT